MKRREILSIDDAEQLQHLLLLCRRLMKDVGFPWWRMELQKLSGKQHNPETREMEPCIITVPGVRFGSFIVHGDWPACPEIFVISHFATGRRMELVGTFEEAAWLCGALEYCGVPWDTITTHEGWEAIRRQPYVEALMLRVGRAFSDATRGLVQHTERTPLQRLADLVTQADLLRSQLEIHQPNEILREESIDDGDTMFVVTADGLGGADVEVFDDYHAGKNNRQRLAHRHFETEALAIATFVLLMAGVGYETAFDRALREAAQASPEEPAQQAEEQS